MFFSSRGDEPTIFGAEGQHALMQLGGSWYWWAAAPGIGLAALGLAGVTGLMRREPSSAVLQTAIALSLLGLPLMILVVAISGSWMYARFTFFALPGGVLLMAAGLDALWAWRRLAGAIGLAVLLSLCTLDLAVRPPKQPLRQAADYVRAHRRPDDRMIAVGLAHEVLRVYADDMNLVYSLHHGADLRERLARHSPQWIVVEYPNSVPPEVFELIDSAGWSEAARFPGWVDWTNGDVVVYRKVQMTK